jgi:hypothetical protein
VIPALGWWLLMRAEDLPVTLWTAVQADLMGFPIDFVVPSAYLGGEPLKTLYVARVCQVPTQRVLATVMVAKFQEFGGLILGMIVATAFLVWHTDYFPRHHAALLLVVTILLAGALGMTGFKTSRCWQYSGLRIPKASAWDICRNCSVDPAEGLALAACSPCAGAKSWRLTAGCGGKRTASVRKSLPSLPVRLTEVGSDSTLPAASAP